MFKPRFLLTTIIIFACLTLSGCGKELPDTPKEFDGSKYLRISEMTEDGENPQEAAANVTPVHNYDQVLSVPTYITKVDDLWFIVDCYHNRIIYTDTLGAPLNEWYIMTEQVTQPHTLATDGQIYLVDDTENNRIRVYEKFGGVFLNTQIMDDIGNRPHFSVYDEASDTFYVWSSESGELFCFRHTKDSTRLYLTDIRKVEELSNTYVRSFTIIGNDIYFVSGVSSDGSPGRILDCDLKTLKIKKSYPVPDSLAGMVQITPVDDMYYITVSTDITGNQDYATLIRTESLDDLSDGNYEDLYADYFIGGGTPYNISKVDNTYFLTEHRLQGHSIWSFEINDGAIENVTALY